MPHFHTEIGRAILGTLRAHLKFLGAKPDFSDILTETKAGEDRGGRVLLSTAFRYNFFSRAELTEAVETALTPFGFQMHEMVLRGVAPSQVPSPEALAFVLSREPLMGWAGVGTMDFGSETPLQFLARADGLVERVFNDLISASPAAPAP